MEPTWLDANRAASDQSPCRWWWRGAPSRVVAFTLGVLALAAPVGAQTPSGRTVVQLIDTLFQPTVPFNPDNEPLITPQEYFQRQRDSREGIAIGLGTALASFPLGASSAGFTYVADPKTGDRLLKTVSFGPLFVERAATNGRGVFNLGVNFQVSSFDRLQGVDMKNVGFPTNSQLGRYLTDNTEVGDSWHTKLDVDSRIFVVSGSYGVTDQFDIGWAIPVASLSVHGQFVRSYNGAKDWDQDVEGGIIKTIYPNKIGTIIEIDETVEASGIGDIVLRGKFAFGPPMRQSALIAAEVRLPTGDEENLLGTGKASVRVIGGASLRAAAASFNVNGGYTAGGLTDEINLAAGTEFALLPRKQLTATFDVVAQTLRDTVTSIDELVSFDRVLGGGALDRRVIVSYRFWDRGSTTLLRAAIGGKYAIAPNWLITASALFRLNDNGYQPKITPFVGLERTWSKR